MIKFTEFSLKNAAVIILMCILILFGGIYASSTLKVESMPDITFPVVMISTIYNAPPADVVEQVTKPLEKAVANMKGLKNLTSYSNDRYSQIIVELVHGTDLDDAKRDIESLVANAVLPANAEKPRVMTFGFASEPVFYMAVYGEAGMSQAELNKIYKDVIEPDLNGLDGLDHFDAIGNQEAMLKIRLDAAALLQYGLAPSQITAEIKSNLTSSPAGAVKVDGNDEMVRVTGQMDSIHNLSRMPISSAGGTALELGQIAEVEAVYESKFYARLDNKPAIGIHIYKTKETNSVEFGEEVRSMIERWERTLPNVAIHEVFSDSEMIKQSIDGMVNEGVLGAILASLMILLFLRNVRMTLIVLVSIPLSILTTLLFMAPLGISLNIMTLGGLAIAIGRVVDDSIVVVENIYSQLAKAQERGESVIILATKQVASAITSSTLTTVGVFGPIVFVSGTVGEVFRPFGLTLACALLASLLVALTVIPLLAKLLVLRQAKLPQAGQHHIGAMAERYGKILVATLNRKGRTLLVTALLFVISIVTTVPFLPVAFMPPSEADKQMYYIIEMPRETSIEAMNEKMKEIEAMFLNARDAQGNPQFTYVESLVGYEFAEEPTAFRSTMFTEVNGDSDAGEVLKTYEKRILERLPATSTVTGSLISFGGGYTGSAEFSYSLKGNDQQMLQQAAAVIKERMKAFDELSDIKDSLGDSKQEVEVVVDPNKARLYGMTTGQVLGSVHEWIKEEELGEFKFDNVVYDLTIGIADMYKNATAQIEAMPLITPTGAKIKLADIAEVRHIDSPATIVREKEQQVVRVTAKIDSNNPGGVSAMVSTVLNEVELPPGVSREVAGVSDEIEEGFGQMFVAMAASVFVVYIIMVLAFGNAGAPLAILFSLPLAVIGGLYGLLITGESINVTSLIGFLMLIGIVVTNAIVLIDRVQQLREEGYDIRDALVEAGKTRLRPILMTAGATILALMPLAFGLSQGTLISKGLAVVVIGGLITSTLLTLIVVPIVYETIERVKQKIAALFHRRTKKPSPETAVG